MHDHLILAIAALLGLWALTVGYIAWTAHQAPQSDDS